MRGVRFTKAEQAYIRERVDGRQDSPVPKELKLAQAICAKLDKANDPEPRGIEYEPLQVALIAASRGKCIPITYEGGARASRQALVVGATCEQMALVGGWLARQRWLTDPLTILTVLNKWPEWYPKAKASAPPKGTREGLGGRENEAPDLGQGLGNRGSANPSGRVPSGFR